jgi:competence protein ComEA
VRGRGRDEGEDEARRRFDAVWTGAARRPESTVDAWRRYDEKPDAEPSAWPPAESAIGPGRAEREHARAVLGAFDPGRRGLRALLAVGVVVVLVAAYLAWRAMPHAEPVPPSPSTTRAAGGPPSAAARASSWSPRCE